MAVVHSNMLKEHKIDVKNYPLPGATSYLSEALLLSLSLSAHVILRCKALFGENSKSQKLTVETNHVQSLYLAVETLRSRKMI